MTLCPTDLLTTVQCQLGCPLSHHRPPRLYPKPLSGLCWKRRSRCRPTVSGPHLILKNTNNSYNPSIELQTCYHILSLTYDEVLYFTLFFQLTMLWLYLPCQCDQRKNHVGVTRCYEVHDSSRLHPHNKFIPQHHKSRKLNKQVYLHYIQVSYRCQY